MAGEEMVTTMVATSRRPVQPNWSGTLTLPGVRTAPFVEVPSQMAALGAISNWLENQDPGLGILAGPEGSGKSRLMEHLVLTLAENEDRLIGVIPGDEGKRSDAAFLREAIAAFGGKPTGRTGLELTLELRSLLNGHRSDPAIPVLLVDDASFAGSRLEILRAILADNGGGEQAAVQIALFGPAGLPDRITRRRQLSGMVQATSTLPSMPGHELRLLIDNWLATVKKASLSVPTLPEAAMSIIVATAEGTPGRALDLAHETLREALAIGMSTVSATLVQAMAPAAPATGNQRRGRGTRQAESDVVQTHLQLPGLALEPDGAGANQ
jgi:type II secretory pathway predicted ATPase ExeA